MQLALQALVVGQESGGVSFEAVELGFEVFDTAFFALAKCALTAGENVELAGCQAAESVTRAGTYAARF